MPETQKTQAEMQKDHIAINTDQFTRPFENVMVDIDKLSLSPNASIFRTPKILSRHNEKAYKPNAFSFGPLHFGDKQLESTQRIKWKYLQGLLYRLAGNDPAADLQEQYRRLIEEISSVQKEARECYAGPIESSIEKVFLEIMVLDGCFIIELFRKDANKLPQEPNDPIFAMSCFQEYLNHDLILLENQIPWLVLEHLFSLPKVAGQGESLIQLTLDFFSNIFSSIKPSGELKQYQGRPIKHILDLLRHSLLIPLPSEKLIEPSSEWEPFPCATKINEAGIKFKKGVARSILDIKFNKDGDIEIPPLLIQETTETIFRNLISLEQCCPNYQPLVTSYAKLMDNLIDTDKDVEILCDSEILDNWLNPEDAKQFFNKLYIDTYVKKFYYHDICKKVNCHRKDWWPRWRFFYVHNYFGTPWAIVSQVVGTILLVLTFLQTLYSILGVVGGKHC